MPEPLMLRSGRLAIVPFSERHLTERYVSWLNDPGLMRYSEQRFRTHTLASCREYMKGFEGTPSRFWAVEENGLGLGHIGTMTTYVDTASLVADVGILIGEPAAREKGYGLEAWRLACAYLLEAGGMRKVTAGTLSVNAPMLRIMERSGMVPDGVRRRQVIFDGREVDVIHMALFRAGGSPAGQD